MSICQIKINLGFRVDDINKIEIFIFCHTIYRIITMEQHTIELIGMVLVAVITALVGPAVLEYVKVKLSKPVSKDIVRDDIERNLIIFDEISEIRDMLDGDRIWISQFHNGGHFLHTNKSIQKFSITYEDVKPGVSSVIHLFTDIPLSLYSRAMNHIMENKHLWIPDFKDETVSTCGLKSAADATGTNATYAIGLFDIATDRCIGTMGIDYRDKKKLTQTQKDFIIERGSRLAGYLSVYLKSK